MSILGQQRWTGIQQPVESRFVVDAQHEQKSTLMTRGDASRVVCGGEGECGGSPALEDVNRETFDLCHSPYAPASTCKPKADTQRNSLRNL